MQVGLRVPRRVHRERHRALDRLLPRRARPHSSCKRQTGTAQYLGDRSRASRACASRRRMLQPADGGSMLELLQYVSHPAPATDRATNRPGNGHLCFKVDDIRAACAELRRRGVTLISEPAEITAGAHARRAGASTSATPTASRWSSTRARRRAPAAATAAPGAAHRGRERDGSAPLVRRVAGAIAWRVFVSTAYTTGPDAPDPVRRAARPARRARARARRDVAGAPVGRDRADGRRARRAGLGDAARWASSLKALGLLTFLPGFVGIVFSLFGRESGSSAGSARRCRSFEEVRPAVELYFDRAVPQVAYLTVGFFVAGVLLLVLGSRMAPGGVRRTPEASATCAGARAGSAAAARRARARPSA